MPDDIEYKIAPAAQEAKHFSCALSLKHLDEEGVFAGYASVFNRLDSQHDIVAPGAFRQTLAERRADIKLLWQHDMREPIGLVEELREDAHGLYVKGRLLLDIARAREAYALLKQGVISGLSIGYTPLRWQTDPHKGIRRLDALDLWEISLVTFPANDAARITVVKQCKEEAASEERQWRQAVSCGDAIKLSGLIEKAEAMLAEMIRH